MSAKEEELVGKLEESLRFEKLVSATSTRFVNLPAGKVDEQIEVSTTGMKANLTVRWRC